MAVKGLRRLLWWPLHRGRALHRVNSCRASYCLLFYSIPFAFVKLFWQQVTAQDIPTPPMSYRHVRIRFNHLQCPLPIDIRCCVRRQDCLFLHLFQSLCSARTASPEKTDTRRRQARSPRTPESHMTNPPVRTAITGSDVVHTPPQPNDRMPVHRFAAGTLATPCQ